MSMFFINPDMAAPTPTATWQPQMTPFLGLAQDLRQLYIDARRPTAHEAHASKFWEAALHSFATNFTPELAYRLFSQQPADQTVPNLRRVDSQLWHYRRLPQQNVTKAFVTMHIEIKGNNSGARAIAECESQAEEACQSWATSSNTSLVYALTAHGTMCQIWRYDAGPPTTFNRILDRDNYIDAANTGRSWEIVRTLARVFQNLPATPCEPASYLKPTFVMPTGSTNLFPTNVAIRQPIPRNPATPVPSTVIPDVSTSNPYATPQGATATEWITHMRMWQTLADHRQFRMNNTKPVKQLFERAITKMRAGSYNDAMTDYYDAKGRLRTANPVGLQAAITEAVSEEESEEESEDGSEEED
ncbi:hypothetical protein LTR17_019977 [Elasticomyces elasticus]|nr:hypothetical protein LTR17_019977 [Elasticomyces elasticus]